MAVAHAVPVGIMEQEVPTVSAVAVHGLSLAGGGGAGEQVISKVPQFVVVSEQPGGGPEILIKYVLLVGGMKVSVLNPPMPQPLSSHWKAVVVVFVTVMYEFHKVLDEVHNEMV